MLKIATAKFKLQHEDYPRCYRMICNSCALQVSRYGCIVCTHGYLCYSSQQLPIPLSICPNLQKH